MPTIHLAHGPHTAAAFIFFALGEGRLAQVSTPGVEPRS